MFLPFSSTLQLAGLSVSGFANLVGGGASGGTFSLFNGSDTHNSAPVLVPAFANGVAAQLADTTRDYMVYLEVGTAGTAFTVAIGPTSGTANTVVAAGTATSGESVSIRLPAGWFLKWSAVTATLASQLAIGC